MIKKSWIAAVLNLNCFESELKTRMKPKNAWMLNGVSVFLFFSKVSLFLEKNVPRKKKRGLRKEKTQDSSIIFSFINSSKLFIHSRISKFREKQFNRFQNFCSQNWKGSNFVVFWNQKYFIKGICMWNFVGFWAQKNFVFKFWEQKIWEQILFSQNSWVNATCVFQLVIDDHFVSLWIELLNFKQ